MIPKKQIFAICMMFSAISNAICSSTYAKNTVISCGRIGDYTFEDGQSNVIVANRDAGKQAAITFDDGPDIKYTGQILDILNKYNVKATFFVIGKNAERYPELVKRIISEGHEIGNHTYTHPDMRKISPEELDKEISKTQEIISGITGYTPVLFRPPGGYLSNRIVDRITSNNCRTVLWSWRQDTLDWKCPNVDEIVNTVIGNIKNGDIILFHDYNPGISPTPQALEIIIPKLLDMGFEFVTVSELVDI